MIEVLGALGCTHYSSGETMKIAASMLPEPIKAPLKIIRDAVRALPYRGKGRFCPLCKKSSRKFREYGAPPRNDAQCPHCSALERHRLLWLFLSKKTDIFLNVHRSMLHVAPESFLEPRFKKLLGRGYLTADLLDSRAMVKMDISDIDYPDETFDIVYCSHVLEHVPDDRKAMREFRRVLRRDGWAILLVPITADDTFEDLTLKTDEDRLRVFGQADHVRRYGPDYVDRLRESGFSVEVFTASDLVPLDEAREMGLADTGDKIYYCTK